MLVNILPGLLLFLSYQPGEVRRGVLPCFTLRTTLTRDIRPIEQVILPAFTKLCIIYEGLREEEDGEPDMIPPERILGVLLEYADPAHVVFVLFC
jgi:hypothetical protein